MPWYLEAAPSLCMGIHPLVLAAATAVTVAVLMALLAGDKVGCGPRWPSSLLFITGWAWGAVVGRSLAGKATSALVPEGEAFGVGMRVLHLSEALLPTFLEVRSGGLALAVGEGLQVSGG